MFSIILFLFYLIAPNTAQFIHTFVLCSSLFLYYAVISPGEIHTEIPLPHWVFEWTQEYSIAELKKKIPLRQSVMDSYLQ